MGDWIWWLIVAVVIVLLIIGGISEMDEARESEAASKKELSALGVDNPKMLSLDGVTLAYDPESACVFLSRSKGMNFVEITPQSLLSAEIKEDGTSVQKVSRGRQIGGALAGGALAGPAGAVIGGLGGKPKQHDRVNRIELRIVLSDAEDSVVTMKLLNFGGKGFERNSKAHRDAEHKASEWLARIRKAAEL